MTRLLVVVGPTASGKTELAIRVAEQSGGQIVSADSVQIYKRFDIGSAKPSTAERARARHHLIDVLDAAQETADAARFVDMADCCIRQLAEHNVPIIVCGGTFLWVRALLFGLADAPAADPKLRARHTEEAERYGRAALHARLRRVDPICAARLSPNDLQRVSRALEVFELTRVPLSELQRRHQFQTPRYEATLIAIEHDRQVLWDRIRKRAEGMFRRGFVQEVKQLLADGYGNTPVFRSVGYRQVARALRSGEVNEAALIDAVAQATRRLVKHQLTWLRSQPRVRWISEGMLASKNLAKQLEWNG